MYYAAFAGVVMGNSVIFICDGFSRPISRRRYCGFTLAPAYDFNAAMIYCYRASSFPFAVEYTL